MKNKTVILEDDQNAWFKKRKIRFSSWARLKAFEYINQNGGIDRNIEGDENYGERDSKAIFERTN